MADQFWVSDSIGRVMGPAPLKVLAELIGRGRLKDLSRASTDGQTWQPIIEIPELARLLRPGAPATPPDVQQAEAERLQRELVRLRALDPKSQLGAPPAASVDECRAAFFTTVKRYHPSRLPPGAPPALQQAFVEMTELLSAAMAKLEKPASGSPQPTYSTREFVGWHEAADGSVRVELDVGPEDANLFLGMGENVFFVPSKKALPLLQTVGVTLRFKAFRREVQGQGRVVSANPPGRPPGMAIKLFSASDDDKKFLQYFVKKHEPRRSS